MTFTECLDCGRPYAAPRPESCCDLCDVAMNAIADGEGRRTVAAILRREVTDWAEERAWELSDPANWRA